MEFKVNSANRLSSSFELKLASTVDFRKIIFLVNSANELPSSPELKSASQLLTSTEVDNDFRNSDDK